jgi:16S rRNA (adenine1518-N6/adenine1519-N6)-dimethyltransferase
MKPIKELGQNFLNDEEVINEFVKACDLRDNDIVFEIGPGEGVITKKILEEPQKFSLTSIDIDPRSGKFLEEIAKQKFFEKNFCFTISNILNYLPAISIEDYKIIGAIPYNITSPILHKIVEKENLPKRIVLIIQKEVAEKISDKKKNSYLRLLLNYFYEIEYIKTVSKDCFYPIPKVDSGVVAFEIKKPYPEKIDKKYYQNFLHHLFRSPRKKINKVFSKEILEKLTIDSNLRPQDLSLEQVLKLFNQYLLDLKK